MAAAESLVDIEALHAASEIVQVPLSVLKIDRSYQREPTQALVDHIAENWDEVSSELLTVSLRATSPDWDGEYYVVNGQHRSLGARKRGLTEVWARVIDLRAYEDPGAIEAVFRLRTNVRMSDKPLERFKAQVRAGDEDSIAIVELLAKFDTEINTSPNPELGINAVSTIEKLYKSDDGEILTSTLQAIKDAYGAVQGKASSAAMLGGIAWFILKHEDETDRDRFIEKLGAAGYAAIDRRARTIQSDMGGTLWANYYRAIVGFYNERLQESNKLDWKHQGMSSWKGTVAAWGKGGK